MDRQAEQLLQPDAGAARERAQRQYASLRTSIGWILNLTEFYSALVPEPGAGLALRLRRSVRTLAWNGAEQERIAFFGERFAALEAEADEALANPGAAADALGALALRLEQAAAEALSYYMTMQMEAPRAAELSRPKEEEENSPARLRARAEIGAGVRARLAKQGATRLPAVGLELYRMSGFLDPAACETLVALIERDLFPSAVLGEEIPGFRTSKSCNLSPGDAPVELFEAKVAELLGYNRRFSEVVQGQRYEVGQQFKPHHDFFHRGQSYYKDVTEMGGQRTWTAMLFLNRPEAGGCTGFPEAAVQADPEPGSLLIWNNMAADGRPNPNSLHHGMPVEAGLKYVLTKWFRERPLLF
ncbi:MAG TPA: 2OG-Fe(II) oxygenase [Allosphingosinicella sp.]|jgi:prolyl 4-hydroxylase